MKKYIRFAVFFFTLAGCTIALYLVIDPLEPSGLAAMVDDNENIVLKWCKPIWSTNVDYFGVLRRNYHEERKEIFKFIHLIPNFDQDSFIYTDNSCPNVCVYAITSKASFGGLGSRSRFVRCGKNSRFCMYLSDKQEIQDLVNPELKCRPD